MKNNDAIIRKLQKALNARGEMITLRTNQFYSKKTQCAISIFYVEKTVFEDEEDQKGKKYELFHTTSQLQVILFLADLLYISRGEPLPTDNEIWNEKRKEIDFYLTL